MTKPNEKCPCGTGLKYKKCCSKKDRKNKSKVPQVLLDPTTTNTSDPTTWWNDVFSDDPTTWKHFGERHSSHRFFIGQRVECYVGTFVPGIVVKFNYMEEGLSKPAAYQVLLDNDHRKHKPNGMLQANFIMAEYDVNDTIRPLGSTRTDTCALCGVDSTTMKLSNCSACQRAQYCSEACQRADWKKHKPLCKLIIKDKKRMHDDAKKQPLETKTPQELTEMMLQAVDESNKSMVKRLLKMKEGSFDINQRCGKKGKWKGHTPLTMAVVMYQNDEHDLSFVKRLLKVKSIDVNKYELVDELYKGATPLWLACQKGLDLGISIDDNHDELVELLKSAGGKYLQHKVQLHCIKQNKDPF